MKNAEGFPPSQKTTKNHVKAQVARIFNSCPILSPKDPRAATAQASEVIETLMKFCQSDEHVTETVSGFIQNTLQCQNLIAELVVYAGKTQRGDVAPAGCEHCDLGVDADTGIQQWAPHVTIEREYPLGSGQMVQCGARCACLRGKWLAAMDRRRLTEIAMKTRGDVAGSRIVGQTTNEGTE